MYEEPYRWVEAVGNRRTYLDEQFKQGSPLVAIAYDDGALLLTVSRGTAKLYEIYDRIGLGGMGHPADLEKLRFTLLEMSHMEGFNRSPSDVTAARLIKYGLAPVIKQAFEEIFKAPLIVKIVLAELGVKPSKDGFFTVNYDGNFEQRTGGAVLAAAPGIQDDMLAYLQEHRSKGSVTLADALSIALRAWALGSLGQRLPSQEDEEDDTMKPGGQAGVQDTVGRPSEAALMAHLRETLSGRAIECAVMDRAMTGPSKYRPLKSDELEGLLPADLRE